ncbi:MAG: right-handed parallel beta-helix repeat-containing protein [Saprospiraceae bacterium]|nr:right-handed parallel beta-helix repeat-containing protein [Saprospiraceae bacterium]
MKRPLFHIFLLVAFPFCQVFGIDFYVSTTGNDGNPGTQAQPWRTIQHAAENATVGSTVFILAGTYTEQVWMEGNNGSAGNYITFTHFANDVVILDGGSTNSQTVLFTLSNVQYVKIIGLNFRNAMGNFSSAITVRDGAQHIDLLNNTLENIHFSTNPNAPVNSSTNANPLIVYGDNATTSITDVNIQNNTIRNCRTGFSEALTVNGNVDGFTVLNNTVHDITNIGIDLAGGYGTSSNPANDAARNGRVAGNMVYHCVSNYAVSAGIYADGARDIVIEANTVYGCGRGFELGCEEPGKTASNIIVRSNLAYQNLEAGIGIGGYDYPSTGKVVNCKVQNNTFYDNVTTNNGDGELLIEYTENCSIKQNLFIATNADKRLIVSRLNSTGLLLDYNLYHHSQGASNISIDWEGTIYTTYAAYTSGTGQDANSPFADPQFTSPGSLDFHISASSPAYNAGDPAFAPLAGEVDLDGDARLQFGRVDIGSDEVAMALPVDYPTPLTAEYALFPNPATESVTVQSGRAWDFVLLRNALGQPVARYEFGATILLSQLPSGIYYVQVYEKDGVVSSLLKGVKISNGK